ncbi:MAG: potassium transporter TrkG [Acidobacteriota bacterium]
MNHRLMLRILGVLLLALSVAFLLPLPWCFGRADGTLVDFLASAAITAGVGMTLVLAFPAEGDIGTREGFAIVTFGWLAYATFGSLPYILSGVVDGLIDAFFESMSGFTTTGATIFPQVSTLPDSILVWRALTQWLGGMGFIVLGLAILPLLRVGGMQLFQAEVPGPIKDRLSPRIQDTAKALWAVYFLMTLAVLLLLWAGEMDFHQAVCHALTTAATGGFSTEDTGVGAFGSYVHVVITVFMLLGGINFGFHYAVLFHARFTDYLRSHELRFYLLVILAAITTMMLALSFSDQSGGFWLDLRDAAFETVATITTTGYSSANYELWPMLGQQAVLALFLIGGCAGSTSGGVKVVRILVALKYARLQLIRLIHPRQVKLLKLDRAVVEPEVVSSVLGFLAVYVTLFVIGSLGLAACGLDLVTGATGALSALGNVGPAFGEIGPLDNYAGLPGIAKLLLAVLMLFGRLELFTVCVVFFPSFWRK